MDRWEGFGAMKLRLAGQISGGSGAVNEDAVGYVGDPDDVEAAWALDGVTGINDVSLMPAGSDAQWLVARIDTHLRALIPRAPSPENLMSELINRLIEDQASALRDLPGNYDPPAACIAAVCRVAGQWHALRLGDCRLLADDARGLCRMVEFANDGFDHWITTEAMRLRANGLSKLKDLALAMQPALFADRRRRNRPGGYGVIEADQRCLAFAEYMPLTEPSGVLLASDGFFRLVDCYDELSEAELLARGKAGEAAALYDRLRRIESDDPGCLRFPRFKPADDASAIVLVA